MLRPLDPKGKEALNRQRRALLRAHLAARLPPLPPLPHRVGPGLTYRRRSRRRGLHSQQRKIIIPSSCSGMQYLWSKKRVGMVEDEEQREVGGMTRFLVIVLNFQCVQSFSCLF